MALERIRAPWRGFVTDITPTDMQPAHARSLQDLLPGKEGLVRLRGPIRDKSGTVHGSNAIPSGIWTYGEKILVSHDGDAINSYLLDSLTDSAATAIPNNVPLLGKSTYVNSLAWGRSSSNIVLAWDGSTTLSTQGNGPRSSKATLGHLERLFVLGGSVPGTVTPVYGTRLYYTDAGPAAADALAKWQDDVSGVVNQIVLNTEQDDEGVALARCSSSLAIFCKNSIHMLRGDTPSSFSLRLIDRGRRCVSDTAVLEYGDGVLFLATDGLYHFDGVEFTEMSDAIRSTLDAAVPDNNLANVKATLVQLPGSYVLLAVQVSGVQTFAGLLHVPTRSWATLTSSALSNDFVWVGQNSEDPFVFDGRRVWDLSLLTTPESETDLTKLGFDLDADGVTKYAIAATFESRVADLAMPGNHAVIRRMFADYVLAWTDVLGGGGWDFEIRSADAEAILAETAGTVTAVADTKRHRAAADVMVESHDAYLRAELTQTGTVRAIRRAEFHDAWLEFEPAQQRPSY